MIFRAFCVATLALALAACGDDEGDNSNENQNTNQNDNGNGNGNANNVPMVTCDPDFDMADACGGDITGTWTLGAVCGVDLPAEAAGLAEQCPTAVVGTPEYDVSGTLVVGSGNFAQTLSGTVSADVTVPSECLTIEGTPINCAALEAVVNTTPGLSASCEDGMDGACDCGITADVDFSSSGSYTVNGGVATVTTSGGPEEYYFCVDGDQVTLRETETSNDAGRPIFALGR